MKKIIFALLLCLITTTAFCKQDEDDGRAWKIMPNDAKLVYVVAFSDGYTLAIEKEKDEYPYGYSYGTIKDCLDKFYQREQNMILPIRYALKYIIFPSLSQTWSEEYTKSETLRMIKLYNETLQTR